MSITAAQPVTVAPEYIDARQVPLFSTLSLKTLQRRQKEGADTGLRKIGRRLVFHVSTLRQFLNSTAVAPQPVAPVAQPAL